VLLQRDEDVTFDIGLVKSDGKADYRGAVEAWQTLLDQNSGVPERDAGEEHDHRSEAPDFDRAMTPVAWLRF
jgi:hypothetical protein